MSKSYKTIFKCVAVTFVLLHVVWGVRSGRLNPIPRIPFTLLFTLLPGLITALVVRLGGVVSTVGVVLVYVVIFWLLQTCLALN